MSINLAAGEVHALVGENGAGKSTLMKVLSGACRPDSGSMTLGGEPYAPKGPRDALARGVAMIYQELTIAPHLSVEANVMLGQERTRGGLLDFAANRRLAGEALATLDHPDIRPEARAGSLSLGARQLVEVARALVSQARVIVFDEPTSSLTGRDSARLFEVIARLRDRGLAIVYISHFLEEVERVAARYTVLRDGRSVASGPLAGVSRATIIGQMVGRELDELFPRISRAVGEPILDLSGLAGRVMPKRADLTVRRGEVLGIAGLVGAGRTEMLRVLFGLDAIRGGQIRVKGVYAASASPRRRIEEGIGMLSEDRKGEGLALDRSIADNLTYPTLGRIARWGWIDRRRQRADASRWMAALRIKAGGPSRPVGVLSGGNQQEGGDGPVAPPGRRRPPAGRADPGGRRRLQSRDLPTDRRASGERQGGVDGQFVSARAIGRLRPDRGDESGRFGGGEAGRRLDRTRDHGSGDRGLIRPR